MHCKFIAVALSFDCRRILRGALRGSDEEQGNINVAGDFPPPAVGNNGLDVGTVNLSWGNLYITCLL